VAAFFLRAQSKADRALVVVSDRTANLGLVLERARRIMKSADVMT